MTDRARSIRRRLHQAQWAFAMGVFFIPLLIVCALGALGDLITGQRKESRHG
ncbi:MAG: hypothetical protein HQL45_14165 [Alphaproteobacteria bacterium]|nr:hypothetical protein [Alphaproteobacteria bacterium]